VFRVGDASNEQVIKSVNRVLIDYIQCPTHRPLGTIDALSLGIVCPAKVLSSIQAGVFPNTFWDDDERPIGNGVVPFDFTISNQVRGCAFGHPPRLVSCVRVGVPPF
jgi:hypothetical protein